MAAAFRARSLDFDLVPTTHAGHAGELVTERGADYETIVVVGGEVAQAVPRLLAQLLAGQQPFAVILGCSDSRVPAEIVFDHQARLSDKTIVTADGQRRWRVEQILVDPEGDNLWCLSGSIDLSTRDNLNGPLITLRRIGT